MSKFIFAPLDIPSVEIFESNDRFPVRRVFCVGRNYAAHTIEMGGNPDREPPFFFMKPADAVVGVGREFKFPKQTKDLHHEIELVVALDRGGSDIPLATAHNHIFGYGVGVDLTRRDIQQVAKDGRRPWDLGKGFDESAPMSAIVPRSSVGELADNRIWIAVNGAIKQDGKLSAMIWSIPEMIAILSQSVELKAGDLIFTGTPSGVGPIVPGDKITGAVDGVGEISFSYAERRR